MGLRRARVASLITWRSGLRVGETLALEWRDNDLMTGSYVMVNPVGRFFDNAVGTGELLLTRLREGRAITARGVIHFPSETLGRVRYVGARGRRTVWADSGFYTHAIVVPCRRRMVHFSIIVRQHARLCRLIEDIPEAEWRPIPYWIEGVADVV